MKGTIHAGYIEKCLWRAAYVLPGFLCAYFALNLSIVVLEILKLGISLLKGAAVPLHLPRQLKCAVGRLYLFFHSSSSYVVVVFNVRDVRDCFAFSPIPARSAL